jgi:hypothetical protein
MLYRQQAMCCQHECKETFFFKCQGSYEKLVFHVYPVRNVDFVCKTFDQALWKVWSRFGFHFKFDPNNYKYYNTML